MRDPLSLASAAACHEPFPAHIFPIRVLLAVMNHLIVAAGRWKRGADAPERALYEHYAGRLRPPPTLVEVEPRGLAKLASAERMAREGEALLAKVPTGAPLIALSEDGRALTSRGFAGKLAEFRDSGCREAAFLIGGADGLDAAVKARAALVLSLGPATWPHLLCRALIAEQLYRAACILEGHPYHRD